LQRLFNRTEAACQTIGACRKKAISGKNELTIDLAGCRSNLKIETTNFIIVALRLATLLDAYRSEGSIKFVKSEFF
jgi:hypothetical protein